MEVDVLKTELLIYKNKRSFDSLRYSYNLADAINVLKHDYSWAKGELSSTVLLYKPEKQIILTALHEETEIMYPRSGNSFTFQVIEGKIMFYTHGRNEFLTMGETLKITEKIGFKLTTQEEAVILLTIENEGWNLELKETICLLEFEHNTSGLVFKKQFHQTYESLKQVSLLKSTLEDISSSPFLLTNILGTTIGLVTGYLSKKIVVGSSDNIFRKFLGTILQIGVANTVAQHPEVIKTIGQFILQYIKYQKKNSRKLKKT